MLPGHGFTIGRPVCSGLIVTIGRSGVDAALADAPALPGTVSLITASKADQMQVQTIPTSILLLWLF